MPSIRVPHGSFDGVASQSTVHAHSAALPQSLKLDWSLPGHRPPTDDGKVLPRSNSSLLPVLLRSSQAMCTELEMLS